MSKKSRRITGKTRQKSNRQLKRRLGDGDTGKLPTVDELMESFGAGDAGTVIDLGPGADPNDLPGGITLDKHTRIVETDKGAAVVGDADSKLHKTMAKDQKARSGEWRGVPRNRPQTEGQREKYRESVVGSGPNTGGVGHQRILGTGTGLNVSTEPYVVRGKSEETVALYLAVVETMYACMKNPSPTKDEDTFSFGGRMQTDKEQRNFSRYLWMLLKRAKLISIPPIMYKQLHGKWDRAMSEEAGYAWRPPGYGKRSTEEEGLAIARHTKERTNSLPFPENIPFDVVYFAYGPMGAPISAPIVATKCDPNTAQRMRQVRLLGTLITDLGTCVDFFIGVDTQSAHPNVPTIFNSFHRGTIAPGMGESGGGWLGPRGDGSFDLLPFIINDLVEHVNNFVVLSISSFPKGAKKEWRRRRKRFGVSKGEPPPPYYPYILKSSTRTDSDGGVPVPREPLSYRTDVRGHKRLLVRRGPRPMEPRKWEYYVNRSFRVYIDDEPPEDLLNRMRVKGHSSKSTDEWMAVKELWIDPHMNSNNRDLPYRPKITIAPERRSG